jgi:hypothetical protein
MERYRIIDNRSKERMEVWDSNTNELVGVEYYSRERGQGALRSEDYRKGRAKDAAENRIKRLEAKEQRGGGFDAETGNWYSDVTGKYYGSEEERNAAEKEFDRMAGLEEDVSKFEERITAAGRLREELAENIGARQQGQLMSQLQRSILATGGEQSQVEALVPQIQEGGQRSLQDYLTGSKARTQEQLAQFIPTEISAEYNQAQLADAMKQFLMSESTERAQIQAGFDAEPEWWESILTQGAQGAGQAGMTALLTALASDIRVKENISQVGSLDNGLPVYLFNYKGSQTPQIGLMAQDVEQVNEEAVVEINGIKHVYYAKAVK